MLRLIRMRLVCMPSARNLRTSAALSLVSRTSATSGTGTLSHTWNRDELQDRVAPTSLDFRDTKKAYASKTAMDLLRAYGVFKFCSYDSMMKYQKQLLNMSRRVLGRTLFKKVMRMSIYGQFVAGEMEMEILATAEKHHKHGVRPMFAYTASESHGHAEGLVSSGTLDQIVEVNYKGMKQSVEIGAMSPRAEGEYVKVTGKLTFLAASDIYRSVTSLIDENIKLVEMAMDGSRQDEKWRLIYKCLQDMVLSEAEGSLTNIATRHSLPIPPTYRDINWGSVTTCLAFHLAASQNQELGRLLKEVLIQHYVLPEREETLLLEAFYKFHHLSQKAAENNVCLVLDAEQTYLQSAMDLVTLDLMRIHNKTRPVVHNTYQCYLRRTYDVITRDLASARAEGFQLGAKVVRGGYIDEERTLAEKHGYPDPVNPTFEATTAMYYKVAEELLQEIIRGTKLQVTFATHNEDTVKHILGLLNAKGLSPDRNVVAFAQLLGMRDHVAFVLGQAGIPAGKLLHYGPVEDCVAYLSRRISENKSGVPTANIERDMLYAEIKRRAKEQFQ